MARSTWACPLFFAPSHSDRSAQESGDNDHSYQYQLTSELQPDGSWDQSGDATESGSGGTNYSYSASDGSTWTSGDSASASCSSGSNSTQETGSGSGPSWSHSQDWTWADGEWSAGSSSDSQSELAEGSVSYSYSSASSTTYNPGSGSSSSQSYSRSSSQQVHTESGSNSRTTTGSGTANWSSSSGSWSGASYVESSDSSWDTFQSEVELTGGISTCSNDVAGGSTVGPSYSEDGLDSPGFYAGPSSPCTGYLGDPLATSMAEPVVTLPTFSAPTLPAPAGTSLVDTLPTGSLLGWRATWLQSGMVLSTLSAGTWNPISGWWWWGYDQTPRAGSIPRVEAVLAGEGGSSQSYCMSSPGGNSSQFRLGGAERQVLAPASSTTPGTAATAVALSPAAVDEYIAESYGSATGDANTRGYSGNSPMNAAAPTALDGQEMVIHLSDGTVIRSIERVYVEEGVLCIRWFTKPRGEGGLNCPLKNLESRVRDQGERNWLLAQAGQPVKPAAPQPSPRGGPPAAALRTRSRDEHIGRPVGPAFQETAEMIHGAADKVTVAAVFTNEFVVKPYIGAGQAVWDNVLGTVEGVAAFGQSVEENGLGGTVLRIGKGAYTVVTTVNEWAPAVAGEALNTLLGDDNVAKGALAANILILAIPGGEVQSAKLLGRVGKAVKAGEAITVDEVKVLISKSKVLMINKDTGKVTGLATKVLTDAQAEALANKLIVQSVANRIKLAIKEGEKFEVTVDTLEQALQAVRQAMPDAVELPRAVASPYPNPPSGVEKYIQIHPAEPPYHDLPHVQYVDWTGGKRREGGVRANIYFKQGGE